MKPNKPDDKRPRRDGRDARPARDGRPSRVSHIVKERWRADAPPPRATQATQSAAHNYADASPDISTSETQPAPAHIYGVKPVLEALRAGTRPLERILISDTAQDSRLREVNELARLAGTPVRRIKREEIERFAGVGVNTQGVVALVAAARYHDADELLVKLASDKERPALAVVLDGVEDPRNLGAIIRTAECAGVGGVFIPERRAAGLTDTVAKTAAGALEYVSVARTGNVVQMLERMKEHGIWTVGAIADVEMDYTAWDWRTPTALVLGGEGEGLRRLVRERCDALVRIPLMGHIESLNVSVAAGIVLYEAVRQRKRSDK